MRTFVILFVVAASLSAQLQENPVVRGMIEGARMAKERSEQQLIEQQTRILKEQERAMRDSREEQQSERQKKAVDAQQQNVATNDQMDQAIARIAARFPDWQLFRPEMSRLFSVIDIKGDHYDEFLECLYVTAKYSTCSQSPNRHVPEGSLAHKLQTAPPNPTFP